MKMCDCSLTYTNTGTPECKSLMAVIKKAILVPTYDSTGARNKIAAGATLNDAYFVALINQADKTKRWYPLPEIANVESVRAEPQVETLASGKKIFIQEGIRTLKAWMIKQPVELKAKLDNWRCLGMSVYFVDKEGNLIGSTDGTDFYPIIVDNDTLFTNLILTTDTTVQKLELNFEFKETEDDGDLRIITQDEAGTDLLLKEGLLDIDLGTVTTITATTCRVPLTYDYGTWKTPNKATGFVTADFVSTVTAATSKMRNTTDSADVAITVAEVSDGIYELTFSAQTATDVCAITLTHNGFEFGTITFICV